jgi:5-methylthioribose kinase
MWYDCNTVSDIELLDAANARQHLTRRGLTATDTTVRIEELGGGVSSVVLGYAPSVGESGVLKQPRHRLRVPFEWLCPLERSLKEVRCLELLREHLDEGTVPRVLDFDPERYIVAMTSAPAGTRVWKDDLLAGRIDLDVASRAARLLRRIHDSVRPTEVPDGALDDAEMLVPLRVDPYYRAAAAANPAVAVEVLAAAALLTSGRRGLVLGDFVPKNILIRPDGGLVLIDFEVAHYGHPAYDPASCLNHLLLKALAFPVYRQRLTALARIFWQAYNLGGEPVSEPETLQHLGALLLARVDGLSPAEYLPDISRAAVRPLAYAILRGEIEKIDAAIDLAEGIR